MSTTTTVFLNSKAGQLMTVDEADMNEMVRQYLGEQAGIVLLDPPELFRALEEAYASATDSTIIVGGGDGTVSAAARLAVTKHKSIGVLPLGTMNLLARALGIPLELDAALKALATADVVSVDIGTVNGKPFFNHVSIGVHPRLIQLRDKQGYSGQLSKLTSGVKTLARAFDGHVPHLLRVQSSSDAVEVMSAGATVTVNPVPESPLQLPFRPGQQYGRLGCYILPELEVGQLIELAGDLIAGRWSTTRHMRFLESSSFTIKGKNSMHMSVDGEVELHEGPLHCEIQPSALRVLMPQPS